MKADFYVAPGGDDEGPGTIKKPFGTVVRARNAVRELKRGGLKKDVFVLLRGGTYELEKPLTFGPEDGGTEKHSVTYAAYGKERPVFTGGTRITGWRQEEEGVWMADLPEVKAGKWSFRGLFVNGRRATRARSPNRGFFRVVKPGPDNRTSFFYREGDIPALKMPGDAELGLLHDWATSRITFKSMDPQTRRVTLIAEVGTRHRRFTFTGFERHPRYLVEGAAEMLDAPGEWYLDTRTGRLTYLAKKGEKLNKTEIVAPRLERLLEVKGRGGEPVRNLHLVGLTFEHTSWPMPEFGVSCGQAA
ncbi:MAG: hypothetical protein R6V58_15040, partial [Planctomycetota bacterium]